MFNNFRFFKYFQLNKITFKKENIPVNVFFILSAFFIGNIFGLLTKNLNSHINGFLIIILLELINNIHLNKKLSPISIYFNFLKRGFLIGIFIEAFKVGS